MDREKLVYDLALAYTVGSMREMENIALPNAAAALYGTFIAAFEAFEETVPPNPPEPPVGAEM